MHEDVFWEDGYDPREDYSLLDAIEAEEQNVRRIIIPDTQEPVDMEEEEQEQPEHYTRYEKQPRKPKRSSKKNVKALARMMFGR